MATGGDNRRGFPEELASEILCRLPVKSLLRFRRGCKSWCALIKDPYFIKRHLKNNKEPQLLIYNYAAHRRGSPPIYLINSQGNAVPKRDKHFRGLTGMDRLLGSVDGLFLLERENDERTTYVTLWNPATREVRSLPVAQIHRGLRSLNRGFGVDPLTNDCKVIYFEILYDIETSTHSLDAALYSCSTDSWRAFIPENWSKTSIYRHCYGAGYPECPAYLNGSYHWMLVAGTGYLRCRILAFDFSNEVFKVIEGPDVSDSDGWGLLLLDDSIALLHCTISDGWVYDIWVMTQPGVWNKFLTFECFTFIRNWYSSTALLVSKTSQLVAYNVKSKEMRYLGFKHRGLRTGAGLGCAAYCYKESLISIKR